MHIFLLLGGDVFAGGPVFLLGQPSGEWSGQPPCASITSSICSINGMVSASAATIY
jgi:hypothetical protein